MVLTWTGRRIASNIAKLPLSLRGTALRNDNLDRWQRLRNR